MKSDYLQAPGIAAANSAYGGCHLIKPRFISAARNLAAGMSPTGSLKNSTPASGSGSLKTCYKRWHFVSLRAEVLTRTTCEVGEICYQEDGLSLDGGRAGIASPVGYDPLSPYPTVLLDNIARRDGRIIDRAKHEILSCWTWQDYRGVGVITCQEKAFMRDWTHKREKPPCRMAFPVLTETHGSEEIRALMILMYLHLTKASTLCSKASRRATCNWKTTFHPSV